MKKESWWLSGWNRAWELGNHSCRVLFGGYRADVRFAEAKKVLSRDYTPEARRLFLSGIARCTTVEELQHEMDCIIDLIPDGHPLKVELLQKLKEQIGVVRDSVIQHNT